MVRGGKLTSCSYCSAILTQENGTFSLFIRTSSKSSGFLNSLEKAISCAFNQSIISCFFALEVGILSTYHQRDLCGVKVLSPRLFQSDTTLPTVPSATPNTSATCLRNVVF